MPKLLSGFIAKQIGKALGPHLKPATLIKTTEGAYTPGASSGDTAKTVTPYSARGMVSDYDDADIVGTLITRGDRQVMLLGATIALAAVPANGDAIAIEGVTYRVLDVKRDPDGATYTCQCRA